MLPNEKSKLIFLGLIDKNFTKNYKIQYIYPKIHGLLLLKILIEIYL